MDRKQEEDVLRITEHYVAEVHAGRQPRLSDYLRRYPQYAVQITDFVAYYHAVEAELPMEVPGEAVMQSREMPVLSEGSRAALAHALERIERDEAVSVNMGMTLQEMAHKQGFSLSRLATEVGLSLDIVEKLVGVRVMIDVGTVPQEVFRRIARALQEPVEMVQEQMGWQGGRSNRLQLADARAAYKAKERSTDDVQSFREAIEQSTQLSAEQKMVWDDILTREKL